MRYVCSEPRAPRPRDRGLGTRSGPTATPAFKPALEVTWARAPLSSSSASKFSFQCFIVAPTGARLRRWLDHDYKDIDYLIYFIFNMDDNSTNPYARQAGGGDKATANAARNERARARAKVTSTGTERGQRTQTSVNVTLGHYVPPDPSFRPAICWPQLPGDTNFNHATMQGCRAHCALLRHGPKHASF